VKAEKGSLCPYFEFWSEAPTTMGLLQATECHHGIAAYIEELKGENGFTKLL
jgi:hypothetical protein